MRNTVLGVAFLSSLFVITIKQVSYESKVSGLRRKSGWVGVLGVIVGFIVRNEKKQNITIKIKKDKIRLSAKKSCDEA
ncbi:unnamed protein product [Rhizophagus irregularis]|nr:unnamed protein product [Rhizophagus irregularis]CAB5370464.1 unnamed protein product [Rhizophagus irregularis]